MLFVHVTRQSLDILLYTGGGQKAVIMMPCDALSISFYVIDRIKLVSAPWSSITFEVTFPFANNASKSGDTCEVRWLILVQSYYVLHSLCAPLSYFYFLVSHFLLLYLVRPTHLLRHQQNLGSVVRSVFLQLSDSSHFDSAEVAHSVVSFWSHDRFFPAILLPVLAAEGLPSQWLHHALAFVCLCLVCLRYFRHHMRSGKCLLTNVSPFPAEVF